MEIQDALERIAALEYRVENDDLNFLEKLEIKDKILEIKRTANLIKPPDSPYTCEGCSA